MSFSDLSDNGRNKKKKHYDRGRIPRGGGRRSYRYTYRSFRRLTYFPKMYERRNDLYLDFGILQFSFRWVMWVRNLFFVLNSRMLMMYPVSSNGRKAVGEIMEMRNGGDALWGRIAGYRRIPDS